MIKFFRNIRRRMLGENKFSKYLLYAIGEIVLVVIGILIALQINNWNQTSKDRAREIKYLQNLRIDLVQDLNNLNSRSIWARRKTDSAIELLAMSPPSNEHELYLMDSLLLRVAIWISFNQRANTMEELTSSGNLSLIKNDSIKSLMLNLKQRSVHLQNIDHHIRQEFDSFVYPPMAAEYEGFAFFDLQELSQNDTLVWQNSIDDQRVPPLIEKAENLLNNNVFRNGLRLAAVNFKGVRLNYQPMIEETEKLIALIDEELKEE